MVIFLTSKINDLHFTFILLSPLGPANGSHTIFPFTVKPFKVESVFFGIVR